jgi:hypothetical protein
MASTTTTAAGVEVPQEAPTEEVEPMQEGVAPAVEGGEGEVMDTDGEEEEGSMSDDDEGGTTSGDEQPAGEAAAIPSNPTGATHEVRFDANHDTQPNLARGPLRTWLRAVAGSTAVRQILRLKKGADPAEVIQLLAQAKLNYEVITSPSAMAALAILGTRAEMAQLKIARAAIAAASATQAKKKKLANALARVAKLEALETELTEHQKKSLALDKKKVEAYSKELEGK